MKQIISLMLSILNTFLKTTKNLRLDSNISDIKKEIKSTLTIKEDYMSPERKEYYKKKQLKLAFYIVANENKSKENPPTDSTIIGLDKELEKSFIKPHKSLLDKNPSLNAGMRINRSIISHKNKKDKINCPNLPTQWKNTLELIIPKAEFGHFTPVRKAK